MKLYWRKKLSLYRKEAGFVLLVLAFATILRLIFIGSDWPLTSSDEATMGLMGMHIAFRGEHPIFYYGQSYMGALEAYIAAFFFSFFGPSLFFLRLGLVLLFTLFLCVMYTLVRLLYTKKYALFSVFLLSLGSSETLTKELRSGWGTLETLLFGSLALLLAFYFALTTDSVQKGKTFVRPLLYWLLACAMGLGIWSNMLILPFVGIAFLVLFLFCRHEWRTKNAVSFVFGFLVGIFPLLLYNIENPSQNSLVTLWQLHNSGGVTTTAGFSFIDSPLGAILISIPMATNAATICPLSTTPGIWREQLSTCVIPQGAWSAGFLTLYGLATVLTLKKVWNLYQVVRVQSSVDDQRQLVLDTARLAVLLSASITLLAFILSPAPALVPATASRYLVGLLVVFPCVLAPLWEGIPKRTLSLNGKNTLAFRYAALLLVGVLFIVGTINAFQQIPRIQAINQSKHVFIADLLHIHAQHIYSDYWTCNDVIFQSRERIICSVLDNNLKPGQDRYVPYRSIVQQDPHALYVFHIGSSQATLFSQKIEHRSMQYAYFVFDGYIVYKPTG